MDFLETSEDRSFYIEKLDLHRLWRSARGRSRVEESLVAFLFLFVVVLFYHSLFLLKGLPTICKNAR